MADDQRKGFTPPTFQRNGPRPVPRPPAAPTQHRSNPADEVPATQEGRDSTPQPSPEPQTPPPPPARQQADPEPPAEEHTPQEPDSALAGEGPAEEAQPVEEPTPSEEPPASGEVERSEPGWMSDRRGRPNPMPTGDAPVMSGTRSTPTPEAAPEPPPAQVEHRAPSSSLDDLFDDARDPVEHAPAAAAESVAGPEKSKKGRFRTRKPGKPKTDKRKDPTPEDWPMAVPVPGGKLKHGRGASIALRYSVLGGAMLVAIGFIGVSAYGMGRTSVPDVPEEVDSAVSEYGLTTFDTESAEAYAEDFLRQCLRRYKQTPEKPAPEEEERQERLSKLTLVEQDAACDMGDKSEDVRVTQARSVGKHPPVEGMEENARYITVQVSTTEPSTARYTVPVRLDNPEQGLGARVIGSVGLLPVPRNGSSNTEDFPSPTEDDDLSREWESKFIPEVVQAWVASDNLSQYLVSGATRSASNGLNGAYENVKVDRVRVIPAKGVTEDDDTGDFVYTDGDEVVANVSVTMTSSEGGTATGSTYRITLRKQGEHWFVKDVEGGGLGAGTGEE